MKFMRGVLAFIADLFFLFEDPVEQIGNADDDTDDDEDGEHTEAHIFQIFHKCHRFKIHNRILL